MRLATWNVNSLRARTERVKHWILENNPDVLCLQETKCSDEVYPFELFRELGYESAHYGFGQWNGVAIISRVGLEKVQYGFSNPTDEITKEARLIRASCSGIDIWSVYVPNGRIVGSEHYEAKLLWLEVLKQELTDKADNQSALLVCGDFNIAPSDTDVFDINQFQGQTHVTERERMRLKELLGWGLVDTAREISSEETLPFTWWDYRGGSFHKNFGMRIDLMLATEALYRQTESIYVDRDARKKGTAVAVPPSDHAPVVLNTTS